MLPPPFQPAQVRWRRPRVWLMRVRLRPPTVRRCALWATMGQTGMEAMPVEGPYETLRIPLDRISEHPDNDYSMDEAGIAALASSIERDGLGQLPLVRELGDGWQMVAGHRRLAAYRLLRDRHPGAGWDEIPCLVARGMSDERASVLLQVTNLQTRELTREERAERILRLSAQVPSIRADRPEFRGMRTYEVTARLLAEAGVEGVTPGAVHRVLQNQSERRAAEREAAACAGSVRATVEVEARAGRVSAGDVRRLSSLPEAAQGRAMLDSPRAGGGRAALRRAMRSTDVPLTPSEAADEARRAVLALERLARAAEGGARPPRSRVAEIEELSARIWRACAPAQRGSSDDDSLV